MIDAATIGIRLALGDGVGDAIAASRRELALLCAAIAAASVELPVLLARAAELAAPARMAALLPVLPRAMPVVTTQENAEVPGTMRAASILLGATTPATEARAGVAAPEAIAASPIAPVPDYSHFGRALMARNEVSPEIVASVMAPVTAPRQERTMLAMGPLLGEVSTHWHAAETDTAPQRAAAMGRSVAPFMGRPREVSAGLGAGPPAAAPAQLDAREAGEGGTQFGAIYMDGEMIGRFVAEHFGEAAMRPPAGASAFDSRLSPAWGGLAGVA